MIIENKYLTGMYSEAGTTYRIIFNSILKDDEVKDSEDHIIGE